MRWGGTLGIGFVVMFGLILSTIVKPVEASVRDVDGFSEKIDELVMCGRKLLLGADEQVDAIKSAQAGGGAAETADGKDKVSQIASDNAMSAEEAAFHCGELDEGFDVLRGRLKKILGE